MLASAGTLPPGGWLPCDGAEVSRDEFAELFTAIGTSHGSGDGITTFNLPDYRGRFLRGSDGGSGRDPGAQSRVASAVGGNIGDRVGSVQEDATALPHAGFSASEAGEHQHSHTRQSGWETACTGNLCGGDAAQDAYTNDATSSNGEHTHAIVGGDEETRPSNAYVLWIIKR